MRPGVILLPNKAKMKMVRQVFHGMQMEPPPMKMKLKRGARWS